MAVVFSDEHAFLGILVFYGRKRCKIGQIVCADDHAASVYTHLSDSTFKPCSVLEHRAGVGIALLVFALEFVYVFIAVVEIDLGRLTFVVLDVTGELAIGYERLQFIDTR